MERLEDEGLVVQGSVHPLLTNKLVLVARADETGRVSSLMELEETGEMLAIADPDLAPAGRYAREALMHLGLWDALQPRLVYGANVRTTLGYVESGNVAAAVVYRTDAEVSDGVLVVETLSEEAHSPIVYPVVALTSSEKQAQAASFIGFLIGEAASVVFRARGFEPFEAR